MCHCKPLACAAVCHVIKICGSHSPNLIGSRCNSTGPIDCLYNCRQIIQQRLQAFHLIVHALQQISAQSFILRRALLQRVNRGLQ